MHIPNVVTFVHKSRTLSIYTNTGNRLHSSFVLFSQSQHFFRPVLNKLGKKFTLLTPGLCLTVNDFSVCNFGQERSYSVTKTQSRVQCLVSHVPVSNNR